MEHFLRIDPEILKRLLEEWVWLVRPDLIPFGVSEARDMFLSDDSGTAEVFLLDTAACSIERIAKSASEFEERATKAETAAQWFLPELVAELHERGLSLKENQCFGCRKPTNSWRRDSARKLRTDRY